MIWVLGSIPYIVGVILPAQQFPIARLHFKPCFALFSIIKSVAGDIYFHDTV